MIFFRRVRVASTDQRDVGPYRSEVGSGTVEKLRMTRLGALWMRVRLLFARCHLCGLRLRFGDQLSRQATTGKFAHTACTRPRLKPSPTPIDDDLVGWILENIGEQRRGGSTS